MQFYTYIHTRSDTNTIFYVGKGKGRRAWLKSDRNNHWHNVVNKAGYSVAVCSYWETEQEALEHEKFLIGCFKEMSYILTNKTDGGEGTSGYRHTEETKAKMVGRKHTERTKQAIASYQRGRTPQKLTEETKAKIREAKLGKKHTEEAKARMGASHFKAVLCIDTGEVFTSIKEAALVTNSSRHRISDVCLGKRPRTNNLRWCFVDTPCTEEYNG